MTGDRHGLALRLVHWSTAGLVLIQFTLAAINFLVYEPRPVMAEWAVQAHISFGTAILALTLSRLALRLLLPGQLAPPLRSGKTYLAMSVHLLLYGCLITLPLLGYIRLAALGFEPSVFGLFNLPALPAAERDDGTANPITEGAMRTSSAV
ncbi:MAG: cytochrome b/b6 domain-containing protein [Pseudomonadota bacterium]